MGIWGQFVYVHPGHGIVIVKTSTDPDYAGRERETVAAFRAIARAVREDVAVAASAEAGPP
jgi:CubicO group peptidase (beta-lactamase class C family)